MCIDKELVSIALVPKYGPVVICFFNPLKYIRALIIEIGSQNASCGVTTYRLITSMAEQLIFLMSDQGFCV